MSPERGAGSQIASGSPGPAAPVTGLRSVLPLLRDAERAVAWWQPEGHLLFIAPGPGTHTGRFPDRRLAAKQMAKVIEPRRENPDVPQSQIARRAGVSRMRYNEELTKAGVLLAGEGLQPSSLR